MKNRITSKQQLPEFHNGGSKLLSKISKGKKAAVAWHAKAYPLKACRSATHAFKSRVCGREASGFLHFMNIDATAVVQRPKMEKANGGNNGRTRNAVQSTTQATTWINCAEGAEAKLWPNLVRGSGWVGLEGGEWVVWDPPPFWGAELLEGTLEPPPPRELQGTAGLGLCAPPPPAVT